MSLPNVFDPRGSTEDAESLRPLPAPFPERTLLLLPDVASGRGYGHLSRCVALAEEWVRRKGVAHIEAAVIDGSWRNHCQNAGAKLIEPGSSDPSAFSWVVLDGYQINSSIQAQARTCRRLVAIDDHRKSVWTEPADVVVDPNIGAAQFGVSRAMAGPRYALLRRSVLAHAGASYQARGVLLVGGGSPPAGVLDWMDKIADGLRDHVAVDVIRGGDCDLPAAMARSELVVTAAGTALLEAFALGRPVAAFTWADNQRIGAGHLPGVGVDYLGDVSSVEPETVVTRLRGLLDDRLRLSGLARVGRALVDGRGSRRVVSQLLGCLLNFRRAKMEDADLLWRWANDHEVRSNAFSSDPIIWDDHVQWLLNRLGDPASEIVVASSEGTPIGQASFVLKKDAAEIGVSLSRHSRGCGLGGPLIAASTDWFEARHPDISVVEARVLLGNVASHTAFLDADYTTDGTVFNFPAQHVQYSRKRNGSGS